MADLGSRLALAALLAAVALAGCATQQGASDPERLEREARQAALPIDTPREALQAGYEPEPHCVPDMGVHWVNDDLLDAKLNVSRPEAVLFLPQSRDVDATTTGSQRFLGVEYVAVTQGSEHNTSESVPTLLGVPLDGPMAGHAPGDPWHADLHLYLAGDLDPGEGFPARVSEIDCPRGTTPPGASDDNARETREADPASCREVLTGRAIHEHARVEIYLDGSRPHDLSPERYQLAHRQVHFEAGQRDAGGAIVHVHEARPTVGCVFETLGWNVDGERLITDRGVAYQETAGERFEVFVDGRESDRGFDTPVRGGRTYVIRFNSSAPPTPCPGIGGGSVHEHASLEVRLNASTPWDFSRPRYQRQAGFVHFEDGPQDARGARVHVHQARPSLGCLFSTLGWETSTHRIETDTGDVYEAANGTPIEVLVNGEPAEEGFDTPIRRAHSYEIRYNATPPANASTGADGG